MAQKQSKANNAEAQQSSLPQTNNPTKVEINIAPPNLKTVEYTIRGDILVEHRQSEKMKKQMEGKIITGTIRNAGKTIHAATTPEDLFNAARYISEEGWDGFNAVSVKASMVSACRVVNLKMTVAKQTIFVIPEGRDAIEPWIQLIRIHGEPVMLRNTGRTSTGVLMMNYRPAYLDWSAKVRIRFDADIFSLDSITNLLMRAGEQSGLNEGRASSPNSVGMGWGAFTVDPSAKMIDDAHGRKKAV